MAKTFSVFVFGVLFAGLAGNAQGLCYLEDANSDCAVCWKRIHQGGDEGFSATKAEVCPEGITAMWDEMPKHMVAGMEYPVSFTVHVNRSRHEVLREDNWEIPHANIHSCIASRGACTPFVGDTPGLATHTAAMMSDLDSSGYAKFTTKITLKEDQYTIIAHIRLVLPGPTESELRAAGLPSEQHRCEVDLAIGVTRSVQAPSSTCPPGEVPIHEQCTPCPRGHRQSGNTCTPCERGTFGPSEGLSVCYPCQSGYANQDGMTECIACPENTQRLPGSAGVEKSECFCKYGFYQRNFGNRTNHTGIMESAEEAVQCEPCPAGAECEGFYMMPYPKKNYWGDKSCRQYGGDVDCPQDTFSVFMECNPERNCLGGPDFACEEGRMGRMCLTPEEGWFIVGTEFFFECGRYGQFVAVAGILLVIACWVLIEILFGHSHPAFATALLFVQCLSMIGTFGLRWHAYLQPLNTALAIADFDVDFMTPWCLGRWSAVSNFYLQLMLPFLFSAGCVLCHLVRHAWSARRELSGLVPQLCEIGIQKIVMVNIIVYHTLTVKCFEVFSCDTFPDGRSYLPSAPSVECGTAVHRGMVFTACVYIPVVLVGTPAFILYLLHKHTRDGTLHSEACVRRWAWLHVPYEAHAKYWEVVLMARRLLVALVASSLDQTSMLQGAVTIIALTGLLAAHVFARPYVSANIDVLDFFSIAGCIIHVLAGMLMFSDITPEASSFLCMGGIGHESCQREEMLKRVVATISVTLVLGTIFVASALAFWVVRESENSKRAARIIFDRIKAECITRLSWVDFPSVEKTKNMVELEQILEGSHLLRWARARELQTICKDSLLFKMSEESYMVVDKGVRQLKEDVTQFSRGKKAEVLRALCEIPGLVEMLCWKGEAGRESLAQFLDTIADFTEHAEQDQRPFPITELVKFEHRPVIALWLLQCSHDDRAHFTMLMDAILAANGVDTRPACRSSAESLMHSLGFSGADLDTEERDRLCGLPEQGAFTPEAGDRTRQPSFSAALGLGGVHASAMPPMDSYWQTPRHRLPFLGHCGSAPGGPSGSLNSFSSADKLCERLASDPSLLPQQPAVTEFGAHWESLRVLPRSRRRTQTSATPKSTAHSAAATPLSQTWVRCATSDSTRSRDGPPRPPFATTTDADTCTNTSDVASPVTSSGEFSRTEEAVRPPQENADRDTPSHQPEASDASQDAPPLWQLYSQRQTETRINIGTPWVADSVRRTVACSSYSPNGAAGMPPVQAVNGGMQMELMGNTRRFTAITRPPPLTVANAGPAGGSVAAASAMQSQLQRPGSEHHDPADDASPVDVVEFDVLPLDSIGYC